MATRRLVQFMHPGDEPAQGQGLEWNCGPHRRKFLVSPGSWLEGETLHAGEIVFWGEWEPQSRVMPVPAPMTGGPRQIFRPYYVRPQAYGLHQNTDPFVFGPTFLYSNCQQNTVAGPTELQSLARGSVILFGSHRAGRFLLDTVFVVASSASLSSESAPELAARVPATFVDVTLRPLFERDVVMQTSASNSRDGVCSTLADADYRLYWGATFEAPVDGMFSFVPCQAAQASPAGFARPALAVPYVNPRRTRGFHSYEVERSAVLATWREVRRQVIEQDCQLGVRIDVPPCETGV